jgi:hypothetical protein
MADTRSLILDTAERLDSFPALSVGPSAIVIGNCSYYVTVRRISHEP